MSSKLTVKAKDRLRKKRDGTPEKSTTPFQESDEASTPVRQVIWDGDLERLQLKSEDLTKVWQPKPPEYQKPLLSKTVAVRKSKLQDNNTDIPESGMVIVAKPAPYDAEVKSMDYTGYAGPRYDAMGHVIPYSLLGTYEDFHREASKRGDLRQNLPSPRDDDMDGADKLTLKYERKKKCREVRLNRDENNALRNWQTNMMERKRQQGYISKLLQKAPEDLAMNQADNFRVIQEKRYLIDRTIPKVDYGKGYRVGSEFWHQQHPLGDDLGGLHMTLNQTQRGYPPPVERVGLSQIVKQEKGCEWLGSRTPHMNYPWHKSPFLDQRQRQLQPYIEEMAPFTPDFEALQLVGTNKPYSGDVTMEGQEGQEDMKAFDTLLDSYGRQRDGQMDEEMKEEGKEGEERAEAVDGSDEGEKVPVFGPSMLFGGQAARWTGDSFSLKEQVGIEARVTFEALTGDRMTSHLDLINDGTTSLYYDWKKVEKENPFDVVTTHVPRFYFNISTGVILPGETLKFPYVFKSPNAGIFTEQWLLETRPVLSGGAALLVTLRGVALQEDKFKTQIEELERELVEKQARHVISDLMDDILFGIRTPERSRSPIDAYLTEEEIFCKNNPRLVYSPEQVSALKHLYSQLFDEEFRAENVWSLSVPDLQQSILDLDDENDEKREDLLQQMNVIVGQLSYTPTQPLDQRLYAAGLQLFQEAVDRLVCESQWLRQTMGLPAREQDEMNGDIVDGRRGASSSDMRGGKGDAGKDKGGKLAGKDVKGSRVAAGKAEPKSKTTTPVISATTKKPSSVTPVKSTPAPPRVPTPGDGHKEGAPSGDLGGSNSQPATPDLSASSDLMNQGEVASGEMLYKEHLTSKMYDIVGDMVDKMDQIFTALKENSGT